MTFQKGNPGRPKGSKNKATIALAMQVAAVRKTPLDAMLDVMDYYYRRWQRAQEEADRQRAADMTLRAAAMAAPYIHPRKLIVEEETAPTINVIDKREMGRMLTVNGSDGHGGSNGSNGHGGNGSNGHGGNGSSNGYGGNGHGGNASDHGTVN
jgi:uncharacterized membrane protein YgcG